MTVIKIVRKIGKILRGGAGRKEIFLGTLCGVLIGFNPSVSFTLTLAILITLILNANFSFVILGAALGKVLCLILSPLLFHTGYFIIHNMGMEDLFRSLCNAPVTALMDLNIYAMIGSLPYALVVGIAVGSALGSAIIRIRKKMLEADQHVIIGKTFGNKVSRLLLRLAFGKSKLSLDDEIPKKAPLFRKSGIILVASVVVIGLLLEFLLLDIVVKKGIQSSISSTTGAEVNIEKAHFSMAGGKLEIENLQITDPDKPTHNLIQLESLTVDTSVQDLLRRSYVIDHMAGHTLKKDVLRDRPGKVYIKTEKEKVASEAEAAEEGKSLDEYLAKAEDWKKYAEKARDYLEKRKENIKAAKSGKQPKASKEAAMADARQLGYLKAAADLVADRPAWTVRKLEIHDAELGEKRPACLISGRELSSHPELNGKPAIIDITPEGATTPEAKLVLRFDDPEARHGLSADIRDINLGGMVETSDSFPIDIREGTADIRTDGTFSTDALQLPFVITVHDLKANVEEGETVMGMDAETATEIFSSIQQLDIEGVLSGALESPRVEIDYDKLSANIKEALVAAGKKELAKRANAEMDKAKAELEKKAGEELDKALESDEAKELKNKASDSLKKLF